MGCDIHGFLEVKKTINGEAKWISADYFSKNPYHGLDDFEKEMELVGCFNNRNYQAFYQLAGVRGYSDDNCKISTPRGLPDDVTDNVKAEYNSWGLDAHSSSYVTLKDVIDFRARLKPTVVTGMLNPEQVKLLDESGILPEFWCGWTNMDGYVKRSWLMMFDPLKELEEIMRERLNKFLWTYTEEDQNENAENIRFVFWFDN